MQIGYARVSTHDQNLDLQRDALTKAGCAKLFTDTISRAKADRPGLAQALDFARDGDILVVWKLDRFGRSLRDLIATITTLHEKGVGFKSITESIDTTTPGGKLIFHVFGALAEFERDLIRERTHAGLTAARARGKVGGRPRVLRPQKVTQLQALAADRTNTIADILDTLNISRTTYYRYVKTAPATED